MGTEREKSGYSFILPLLFGLAVLLHNVRAKSNNHFTDPESLIDDINICLMGEGHPEPNLNMFCALSQNYEHFFEK